MPHQSYVLRTRKVACHLTSNSKKTWLTCLRSCFKTVVSLKGRNALKRPHSREGEMFLSFKHSLLPSLVALYHSMLLRQGAFLDVFQNQTLLSWEWNSHFPNSSFHWDFLSESNALFLIKLSKHNGFLIFPTEFSFHDGTIIFPIELPFPNRALFFLIETSL